MHSFDNEKYKKIAASAAKRLRQDSVTSIIWCIPSSKLLLIDNR